ncbi:MAG: LicD family protein [Methanosphaera sp.]|nr:LicD family protein [Methanosphaera sp.]
MINYLNKLFEKKNRINSKEEIENKMDSIDEKIVKLSKKNQKLNNKIKKLHKNFLNLQKDNEEILNSYNEQFATIFLFYDLKPKGVLKNVFILSQELLNLIVNICNKHGLTYWLDYGTLLGAQRHNSFVPWDDDIDIAMMRTDFNKFLEIISLELDELKISKKISVNINRLNVSGYPIPFIQIFYQPLVGSIFAGLDIFPYDYISNNTLDSKTFLKEKINFNKKILNGVDRNQAINDSYQNLDLTTEKTNYLISGVDGVRGGVKDYKFQIMETSRIFPLKKIEFNNQEYNCPNDIDYYLKCIYGEYMEIPKIIHHHHYRLKSLMKNKETDKIYKEEIRILVEINKKYEE